MAKEDEILERLDLIVQLLIPPFHTGQGQSQDKVLELCDLQNTREDMMKATAMNAGQLDMALSRLREKGVIRAVKRNKGMVYLRVR